MKTEKISSSGKEELWNRITHANRHIRKVRRIRMSVFLSAAASLLIVFLLNVSDIYNHDTIDESLQLLSQIEVSTQGRGDTTYITRKIHSDQRARLKNST